MKPTIDMLNEEATKYLTGALRTEFKELREVFFNSALYKVARRTFIMALEHNMKGDHAISLLMMTMFVNGMNVGRRLAEIESLEKLKEQ